MVLIARQIKIKYNKPELLALIKIGIKYIKLERQGVKVKCLI